jgi:transcriptional regulator with XRE-family HTH domain
LQLRKNSPRRLSPLARHRLASGLTQRELARRMAVRPSTVHCWESGKCRPEPFRMQTLAHELSLTPLRLAEVIDEVVLQGEGR